MFCALPPPPPGMHPHALVRLPPNFPYQPRRHDLIPHPSQFVLLPRKMHQLLPPPPSPSGQHPPCSVRIRSVWANNFDAELEILRCIIRTGRPLVIAIDTEFPGTVVRSSSEHYFSLSADGRYVLVKSNVDRLKLIQLGLTLSDPTGRLPDLTWEFNFADFDPACDPHNPDSITLLRNQGIDLEVNRRHGIDSAYFARLLLASGLVGNGGGCRNITWVTFSGSYDFAYLIKVLTRQDLPETMEEFSEQLRLYFGHRVYDMKNLMKYCGLKGGLEKVASELKVARAAGNSHQAGSDSLLTAHAFLKMIRTRMLNLEGVGWEQQDGGILCGLQVS